MNSIHNKGDEEVKAPDAHSHTPPGAEGWKDVLQLLKEQSVKMEKLARALSVILQGSVSRFDTRTLSTQRQQQYVRENGFARSVT